jgi:hypothetical protein
MTGVTGAGTSFPTGAAQSNNHGFIQFNWDGPQEHGAQITTVTSGMSLTITDNNGAGADSPNWNAKTYAAQPYRIWYGLGVGINIQDLECTSNGISTLGTTITVSLSPACNLNAGQMVHIFQAGPYNSFAPGNNQAPTSFGPITVTTGTNGAVTAFTFTWPTTSVPAGPVASGMIAIGPTNVHIVRNYLQGFTQKAIIVQTLINPSAALTKNVWVESNTIRDCALTCVSFQRTISDHFDHNFIYNPGQYSIVSPAACQGENNAAYIFSENNKCYLNGNFEDGFDSVFTYGGSESGNFTYGTQASNGTMSWPGQGKITDMHLDTAIAMTTLGNQTIGGGRGIFPEVNELSRIVDNDISYSGGQGIYIGKRFDWHTLDNFDGCCGAPASYSLVFGGISTAVTPVNPGALLLANNTTTCPIGGIVNILCTVDATNFVEGIESVKVAIGTTAVSGIIVLRNLPCSPGPLCNSLPTHNLDIHGAPVVSISVFNNSTTSIPPGTLQLALSSQPGCVAPETVFDLPRIAANSWVRPRLISPNFGNTYDVPGVQSYCIIAPSGVAGITFNLDAFGVDVPGEGNIVQGNHITRPSNDCGLIYGGSKGIDFSNNTCTDPMWDLANQSTGIGFSVDPTLQGSAPQGPCGQNENCGIATNMNTYSAIVGGTLSDNVVRYTSGQFLANSFIATQLKSGLGDQIASTSVMGNVMTITTNVAHHVGLFSTVQIVGSNTAGNNGTFYVISVPLIPTTGTTFSVIAPGASACTLGTPFCGTAYPAIDQVRVCKTQVTAQDQNGLPAIGSTNPLGITLDSQQATNYLCPPSQALNANVLGATANIAQTPLVPATYTIPAGEWRINWYMSSVVACAATTVQLTINFTDDTAARTDQTATLSLAANGPTNQAGGTFIIYALAGTAINYSTNLSACSGTATYNLRLTAEQIQ